MKKFVSTLIGRYLNILAHIAPQKAAEVGFNLFCRPFRSKLTKKHLLFFKTAEQSTFMLGNEMIHAYKWGAGPTKILLLHGWQSHTYRWKNYIDTLDKNRYTVYSIDAPGHGQSSGNFLSVPYYSEAIIKYLSIIGKVDKVVSHSIGAFTAMFAFNRNPHVLPDSIVMLAPPGEAKEFFSFYAQQLKLSERCISLVEKHFEKVTTYPIDFYSAVKFASAVNAKGLLIHDEDDDETSAENSKAIHKVWNNSTLVITKGKGHNLKSLEVLDVVINFLDGGLILSRSEDY
jgi:pimeloyl-ACP methyl ester carboxylesterase